MVQPMVGELIADRYELAELVEHGGMSSVYRGRDHLLERNVALKLLHPHFGGDDEYVERFRREARAVAQLSHPNIVTVIDRGASGGQQFIVFEYVDGENLKQLLERTGPLPVRRVVELGIQIADALAKDPARRFASMDAFASELRRCLDFDAEQTIIRAAPRRRRQRRSSRLSLLLALGGLALLAAVAAALVIGGSNRGHPRRSAPPAKPATVALHAVGNYDPNG